MAIPQRRAYKSGLPIAASGVAEIYPEYILTLGRMGTHPPPPPPPHTHTHTLKSLKLGIVWRYVIIIIYKIYSAPIKRKKRSLRRIQYRVVLYNEIGHNPKDPVNKKSVPMEEKKLAKEYKFWASYEKLELMLCHFGAELARSLRWMTLNQVRLLQRPSEKNLLALLHKALYLRLSW